MTTTTEAPRRRRNIDPKRKRNLEESVDALWQVAHQTAWKVRELQRELRDRAHMAAGTDPKSPRYSDRRNRGFWANVGLEVRRKGRRAALNKSGMSAHVHRVQRFREVREKRGTGAAVAMAVIRYPLQYVKTFLLAVIAALLVVFVIFYWVVRPLLSSILPDVPSPGTDPMNPYDVPGFIVPGSYSPGATTCQPVGQLQDAPKGGLEGVAFAVGDAAADFSESDPTPEQIRDGILGFVRDVGFAIGIMEKAAKREMTEPRQPLTPAPRNEPSTQADGNAIIVPAASGGEAQAFIDAIIVQESGGRYDAVGPRTRWGHAYGKYQILETNIGPWSEQYLGRRVSVSEFHRSPEIQDQIAKARLTEYFTRYGARGAASAWYSGNPNKHLDTSPQSGGPSIKQYVDEVTGRMGKPVAPTPTDTAACGGTTTILAGSQSYGGDRPGPWGGYTNGNIPPEALAALPFAPQHKMRPDAAAAMTQMAAAMQSETGERLVVGNTYRSYAQQQAVAAEKGLYSQGGLAAKPGTSNHGWGMAADLNLSRTALAWMRANAHRFGYKEDTPREPWHWAYYPKQAVQEQGAVQSA